MKAVYANVLIPLLGILLTFLNSCGGINYTNQMTKEMEESNNNAGKPEIILILKPNLNITVGSGRFVCPDEITCERLNKVLGDYGASIKAIGSSKNRGLSQDDALKPQFYSVHADGDLEKLRKELYKQEEIESAYIKPMAEDPDL